MDNDDNNGMSVSLSSFVVVVLLLFVVVCCCLMLFVANSFSFVAAFHLSVPLMSEGSHAHS